LSKRKIGALMVIERETGLRDYMESAVILDAKLSKELLISLFLPASPLHDGGVMVRKGRILNARCVLPLTKNPYISRSLGTRHRAAIGLSEETGAISLVMHGGITSDLDITSLRNRLEAIFVPQEFQRNLWKNLLNRA
ncbi:MAG: DNA integrity scanning protein DisA nucleotide-binding domain protein, partial [Deltaproteobacteria bacterium]|nr:DNA integrity scanning protein DisA nucleotide-binding domain protein [Deltaproteobacteria bacterium]